MSTTAIVVVVVVATLGVQALVWIVLVRWIKARAVRLLAAVREELAAQGETATLGPAVGTYRGGTDAYPRVKGLAAIVLTDRRLLIRRLFGDPIALPLDEIVGVREDKWFLRAYAAGRPHVIVATASQAELGFFIHDRSAHAEWMSRLAAIGDAGCGTMTAP